MSAVALAGTALAVARLAATIDAGVELFASVKKASNSIALAQSQNRDMTPEEIDAAFASEDQAMQAMHASIAARVAAPGAVATTAAAAGTAGTEAVPGDPAPAS
jgi:hypothetical protein